MSGFNVLVLGDRTLFHGLSPNSSCPVLHTMRMQTELTEAERIPFHGSLSTYDQKKKNKKKKKTTKQNSDLEGGEMKFF